MRELYECGSCGVVTEAREHLCDPKPLEGKDDYCGTAPESAEMCDTMKKTLAFECGSCGRPAENADLVCNPVEKH
jgi:hypothetical protein